jgi:hypothetical protein
MREFEKIIFRLVVQILKSINLFHPWGRSNQKFFKLFLCENKKTITKNFSSYALNDSGMDTKLYELGQPLHLNQRCRIFKTSKVNMPELVSLEGNRICSCALENTVERRESSRVVVFMVIPLFRAARMAAISSAPLLAID